MVGTVFRNGGGMVEECGIDADIQIHFAAVEQFYRGLNV